MSTPAAVKKYLADIGRKGGSAGRGARKARSSEQARAAVNARWAKVRRLNGADKKCIISASEKS